MLYWFNPMKLYFEPCCSHRKHFKCMGFLTVRKNLTFGLTIKIDPFKKNEFYFSEILADANNATWRSRYRVSPQHCDKSFTFFDADFNIISTDNPTARPVQKYRSSPSACCSRLENLLWLISENKDQTILLLHQYTQGMSHKL